MARFVSEIKSNFSPSDCYPTARALFGKNDPTKVLARADARRFALKLAEGKGLSGAIVHLATKFSPAHPILECGSCESRCGAIHPEIPRCGIEGPPPLQAEARFGASSRSQPVFPALLSLAFDSFASKLGHHQMPKVP